MMCAKRIYTDIDHFQKCHLFTKGYKYSEIQFIYNIEKTYISELWRKYMKTQNSTRKLRSNTDFIMTNIRLSIKF